MEKKWVLKYDPDFKRDNLTKNDIDRKTYNDIALFWAMHDGNLALTRIDNLKIDVNACDCYGHTPLHVVCLRGYKKLAEFLLERGAKVDAVDIDNNTPFIYALRGGFIEILPVLIKYDCDVNLIYVEEHEYTALHSAIVEDQLDIFEKLLTSKIIDVNCASENGLTPLHLAVTYQRKEMVQLLISTGKVIDPNVVNENGHTVLHSAVLQGNLEIVKNVLTMKGVNINCTCPDKNTPLHMACMYGYLPIVKYLLKKGANVNVADKQEGWTPLHWATAEGYLKIVKELIKYKSDISSRDKSGNTPLHLAVEHNRIKVVKYLVDIKGADIYAENEDNMTPEDIAIEIGHNRISYFFNLVVNKENLESSLTDVI